MKTTIEISDALLTEAKAQARRDKMTLRDLVEAGLRSVLRERRKKQSFKLRDASFKGEGLQPEFEDGNWERIRDASYEGRGG